MGSSAAAFTAGPPPKITLMPARQGQGEKGSVP